MLCALAPVAANSSGPICLWAWHVCHMFAIRFQAQKLHCGVGTNTFADCPQCLVPWRASRGFQLDAAGWSPFGRTRSQDRVEESAMNSGVFDFWWNWDYAGAPRGKISDSPATQLPGLLSSADSAEGRVVHLFGAGCQGRHEPLEP